jgi:hypothetical protein
MTAQFTITPTPPGSLKLRPDQQGELSFTVTCDEPRDRSFDVAFAALLIGADGKGEEVEWLVVGPQRTQHVSGGMTQTITITARPTSTSPRGENTIKLIIVDKEQPNEVHAKSSPVICEVLGPPTGETPPPPPPWWRRRWLIPAVVGGVVVVGGGVLLASKLLGGNREPPGLGQPCRDAAPACKEGLVCDPVKKICLAAEGAPCASDGDCITGRCRGNVCTRIDVDPSNGLAQFLDLTREEPDLDLGAKAIINTDDGTVLVDNRPVVVRTATMTQTSAPTIRVFIVRSLHAADVTVTGTSAVAVVSNGDIKIDGTFAASALENTPGAGAFNESTCQGAPGAIVSGGAIGGCGGGGFGSAGARGGSATTRNGVAAGGTNGSTAGTASLVPLRGGCNSGTYSGSVFGAGGGAVQLVSRTKIAVAGVVAANGASYAGGGSGGGILLEAPAVEISGAVVANGGGGAGGCFFPKAGENGRLDATPANGGVGCDPENTRDGGSGGAGPTGPRSGGSLNLSSTGGSIAFAGHAGGGVGRIRVNTPAGGLKVTGVFSPNPSTGTLATR